MKRKVIMGIAFFFFGITLLLYSISSQVHGYISNHSKRTSENIQGIDRKISEELREYRNTLEYIAEYAAYEEGNLLSKDKIVDDLLIVEQHEIVFSKDNKYDYELKEIKESPGMLWSLDSNGEYNLAISHTSDLNEERIYIILLDLKEFYKVVASEKHQPHDGVILIDASGKLVMNSQRETIFIEPIEQAREESVQAVLAVHDETEEKLSHYDEIEPKSGKVETKFIRILPVRGTENGLFTISVKVLVGDSIHNIRQMTMLALASGVVMALGIGLLISVAVNTWSKVKKEKRELEEAAHRQRLETIGILTSGVAHEFSNLLTPIMGYSVMALEKVSENDTEVHEDLVEIYNSALKAKDVIGCLSDLSRKKEKMTYEFISIDEVIKKTVQVSKTAQPQNVQVYTKLDCKEKNVWGSETLLMQMLLNLILNAFHALGRKPEGSVTITSEVKDEQVCVLVKDDGAGIPNEIKNKIFEPFFTTKQSMKGTGLGLVIVQQIIEAHDGKIFVESEEGRWTTFLITLPLKR